MAKTKAVGLRNNTMQIMKNFFEYIDDLSVENKSSYQINLAVHVKQFFDEMNQLGEQEFALFLRKHQFENTNPVQQLKYTDAFNCLVAFIVAEYSESDLLRYFIPRVYSAEDKPTRESNSWRIVYWAQLLGYWARKLFNTQRFVMVNAETANELLESAIKSIKQDLNGSNYFDLQQNNVTFNENLHTVVGKFVENRNVSFLSNAEDSDSMQGKPLPFLRQRSENSDTSTSSASIHQPIISAQIATPSSSALIVPPPPPPAPIFDEAAAAASTSTTKALVSPVVNEPASNDRDNVLAAIRKGIKLKPVKPDEKLPADSKLNDSNDLVSALKAVLSERRKVIEDDSEKNLDENNGEDWVDGPSVIETFHFGLLDDGQLENVMLKLEHLLPDFSDIRLPNVMLCMKNALQSAGVEVSTKKPIATENEVQPKKNGWRSFFSLIKGNGQSQQPAKNPSSQDIPQNGI